uniref:condensation domain-containing protein n=1 Tax=Pelomonas sp. BJYL3 TaxID=2976697 RepID=UPI0022B37E4A
MSVLIDMNQAAQTSHPLPAAEVGNWHELSSIQRTIWFLYRMQPELQGGYNIAFAARVQPSLDAERFQRALDGLAARHPMLRASFAEFDGEPRQRIHSHASVPLAIHEVDSLDEAVLGPRVEADRARPFVLDAAPLIRASLYRDGSGADVMLLAVDHLVCDGWSLWQILEELDHLLKLESGAPGSTEPGPADAPSFLDHVSQQRAWLESPQGQRQFEYWKSALAEPYPRLELPVDHLPDRALVKETRETLTVVLNPALTAGLRELTERHQGTMFATLLSSYFILLHRLTGQDQLAVGSPMPARGREWGSTLGNFTNPVVMRAQLDPQLSVAALLKQVQQTAWRALKNQSYPLVEIVERLNPVRADDGHPYFNALFVYQKARAASQTLGLMAHSKDVGEVDWGGARLSAYGRIQNTGGSGLDLLLEMAEVGDTVIVPLDYDSSKFERRTVERFLGYWQRLLEAMVADEQMAVGRLPILPAAEREQVLRGWNQTQEALPLDRCVHELIEAQVSRDGAAAAVVEAGGVLSYAQLNAQANRLARRLRSLGVGPDVRVALCAQRGSGMLTALLGIWKSGGAYVPLDPAYPKERL